MLIRTLPSQVGSPSIPTLVQAAQLDPGTANWLRCCLTLLVLSAPSRSLSFQLPSVLVDLLSLAPAVRSRIGLARVLMRTYPLYYTCAVMRR